MPSTYSPLLRLELLGAGEQSGLWGDTTNKNVGQLLEQAIAGVTTVSLSGGAGDYTLSALDGTFDESRSAVLKFIGNPSGTKNIIIPTETKLYVVRNDCGQTITVKTAAQVTGVTLLNGEASLVFCDGTNAVAGIATAGVGPTTVANGGTGATSFTAGFVKSPGGTGTLTSSATVNAATELTGTVPLAQGGTGVSSFTAGAIVLGNGSSPLAVLTGNAVGQVATWNGSAWTPVAPATGAVSSVFGRTGIVTALVGDYSGFYPTLTGSGASGTWNININGSAASATTASSVPWSGITSKPTTLSGFGITDGVTTGTAQTITAKKTFSGSGNIESPTYNFNATTSIFNSGTDNIQFAVATGVRMFVRNTGGISITGSLAEKPGGGSWADSSDARLKQNVQPLVGALAKITALNPVTYQWKYDNPNSPTTGFIAQEVLPILPNAISQSDPQEAQKPFIPEGEQVYNIGWQNDMTAYLVGAIKELKAEVDSLKAQLAAK